MERKTQAQWLGWVNIVEETSGNKSSINLDVLYQYLNTCDVYNDITNVTIASRSCSGFVPAVPAVFQLPVLPPFIVPQ